MKIIIQSAFWGILLINLASCTGVMHLKSTSSENAVIIDGDSKEWSGSLFQVEKTSLGLGVQKNAENIYLCIVTNDRNSARQIMMDGLFIWFDEKGHTKKRIGIKYPHRDRQNFPNFRRGEQHEEVQRNMPVNPEFEFYTGEEVMTIYPIHNNQQNIDIEFAAHRDRMVFELKVPLSSILQTSSTERVRRIGIGLETGSLEQPGKGDQNDMGSGRFEGRNPAQGGMGGPSGMGGPGMGGGPHHQGMNDNSKIERWIIVDLKDK
ncbi:MAG: hypothetical protein JXQ65_03210 [Candidatus Marinimicrobia bacterium]|nr:hypothetical protein [Candidatus Neomarinimicrobiota bacterium]